MNPGTLRHRITLQSQSLVSDGMGGDTESWTDFVTLWAKVAPLSGRELFQAQQVNDQLTHAVTLRYYPGVTSTMRILYGARVFLIESIVDTEERHREFVLTCREVIA